MNLPPPIVELTVQEQLFYQSLRIRLIEERLIELYPADKIQSPVHLSIGQEAVATAVCATLTRTDLLFATYRSHAFYLAKGGDLKQMLAELYGKEAGGCGGKAGSMHLAAPEVGFMGSSAVVASSIPHAIGAAMAAKFHRREQIAVAVFGDGATEEGVYHESLNFAAKHQVPVLFVCENNGLAVHSCRRNREAYQIVEHARTYGIAASSLGDGHDDWQIFQKLQPIVAQLRQDRSPHFVEINTFRYREHVGPGEDFDAGYRSRDSMCDWQRKDPLIQRADWVARFRPTILAEIDEAVAFAEAAVWPGDEALLSDVV